MKKIKYLLVSLIIMFAFNASVYAASGSLSVSKGSVYVGDSFTVAVNVNSAAAWNVHVSASGPVSGCIINQADATADAMDTNKSFSATCTATGVGTIIVTLSGDVTSASTGNAVGISGSRSVSVSQKPTSTPPSNNNKPNTTTPKTNTTTDNRSKNNNIKDLSVDGYSLTKVDANNYTLSVPNDVESINIKAVAADSKSKITGSGKHDIKVGENNIQVVVTAENGAQNKINIKVTRKDGYSLEELDYVLKNDKANDINITISDDTKITTVDLEKIKSSGKKVNLNYYNSDKKLLYSWIIDGSKIANTNAFLTKASITALENDSIAKLSNYASGLVVNLDNKDLLPAGTMIKIHVADRYKEGDMVNVYYYNESTNKLEKVSSNLEVKDGYVTFDTDKGVSYLVTMSNIDNSNGKGFNIFLYISIVEFIAIIGLVVYIFRKKNAVNKKRK